MAPAWHYVRIRRSIEQGRLLWASSGRGLEQLELLATGIACSYCNDVTMLRAAMNSLSLNAKVIDQSYLRLAFEQAMKSFTEGGLPIGAVLANKKGVVSAGHNRRMQDGDPIAHGEMDCLRRAGRRPRYDNLTLYTTLSPCMMCAGAILQFGIKRVGVGENRNFAGNIGFLRSKGVEVVLLDDHDCMSLMSRFIESHPKEWDEDIAGNVHVQGF